jgi:hypothetical protein
MVTKVAGALLQDKLGGRLCDGGMNREYFISQTVGAHILAQQPEIIFICFYSYGIFDPAEFYKGDGCDADVGTQINNRYFAWQQGRCPEKSKDLTREIDTPLSILEQRITNNAVVGEDPENPVVRTNGNGITKMLNNLKIQLPYATDDKSDHTCLFTDR